MWENAKLLLETVGKYTQLHATVNYSMENYTVVNHGILSGDKLHSLFKSVKIYLGLGFPLEGPAPLEAIANGAIFINPRFNPPKSRRTYKFFSEKPTLREVYF